MATPLTKNVTRESSSQDEDGRNLLVSINEDQTISIRPKGRTSKAEVRLPIKKVYSLIRNVSFQQL